MRHLDGRIHFAVFYLVATASALGLFLFWLARSIGARPDLATASM